MFLLYHIYSIVEFLLKVSRMNFQDGSYSRGPVDIPIGEFDESNYYLSPTFKFEQVCFNLP